MSISTQIPTTWKLPLFWATVDGSKAGVLSSPQRALLVGQMFTSGSQQGTAALAVPIPVGSVALGQTFFGRGSMLARMVQAFFASNTTQQLWAVPVADPAAGTQSTGSITVASAPAASGTLSIEIAGQLVQIAVGSTDTTSTVASNITAAITAAIDLPVTATTSGSTVSLTCKWKGDTGNDISIIPNYLGQYGGQVYPTSLTLLNEVVHLAATANTATSSPILTFASVPLSVVAGMTVYDTTTNQTIGTVLSVLTPNVTLTANAAFAVTTADNISFRSLTINGQLNGGTGDPDFTAAISAVQTTEYDYLGLAYTDTGSMTSWNVEYGFGSTGRWNFTRQQYGVIFTARRDTYANLLTWGLYPTGGSQNSPVMSTMAIEQDSPTPVWEWAASYCALGSLGFSDDPARPLQTLEFLGVLPARLQYRFSQSQINNLVNTGLAAQAVAPDGNPMIMREQTQYQLNSFGQSDTAFGVLTVLTTLQILLQRMKSSITSKYPRVKLIPDGTKIGPGQAAVTPSDVKAELISEYSQAIFDGLASDMTDFKANLIVQINSQDPNRLDVLWPPQLAGQLRVFAALAQFRLQYPPIPII